MKCLSSIIALLSVLSFGVTASAQDENWSLRQRQELNNAIENDMNCAHDYSQEHGHTSSIPVGLCNSAGTVRNRIGVQVYSAEKPKVDGMFFQHGDHWVIMVPEPMFVATYGQQAIGKEVEIPSIGIAQQTQSYGKTEIFFTGYAIACLTSHTVPSDPRIGLSVTGLAVRTSKTTVTRGNEQIQVDTLVLENCHFGEPGDAAVEYQEVTGNSIYP
jgi:hypothetical protein